MKVPVGIAASSEACRRATGHTEPCHRSTSSGAGSRQQSGSGQLEAWRTFVSRPRNQRVWAKSVPTEIENSPPEPDSMREVHQ